MPMQARYSENPPVAANGQYIPIACDERGFPYVRLADRLDGTLDSVGAARAYRALAVVIEKDSDVSDAFDGRAYQSLTLYMPGAFDGTSVYFESAYEPGAPYSVLCDGEGVPFSVTIAPGRAIVVPNTVAGFGMVRLRCGSLGSPVTQTAQRVVYIGGKG